MGAVCYPRSAIRCVAVLPKYLSAEQAGHQLKGSYADNRFNLTIDGMITMKRNSAAAVTHPRFMAPIATRSLLS